MPVFIPKSSSGDRLKVRIIHQNRDGMQARIEDIISPGPQRVLSPCTYFDRCGGCSLQQLSLNSYREFKTGIVHNALTHAGYSNASADILFLPPDSRRRVEFKIAHNTEKPALAFHEPRSHTPITIDKCLILHPQLQALIAPVNAILADAEFTRYLYALSLTLSDTGIDMLLTFQTEAWQNGNALSSIPNMGICARLGINRISARGRKGAPRIIETVQPVEMKLDGYAIPLPPDAFLQATLEGQQYLTEKALSACKGASGIIDLFSGIGTYSFAASRLAPTHAAEGDTSMVEAMQSSIGRHGITSLSCEQRDLFKHPFSRRELALYDAAIINPPRAGAKNQCRELAASGIANIAMISCNPATFARDARILKEAGYRLTSATAIDQFVFSPHIELVAVFHR